MLSLVEANIGLIVGSESKQKYFFLNKNLMFLIQVDIAKRVKYKVNKENREFNPTY